MQPLGEAVKSGLLIYIFFYLIEILLQGEIAIPILKTSFLIISIGTMFSIVSYYRGFSLLGENRSLGKILLFMFVFVFVYHFASIPLENQSFSHIIGVFTLMFLATYIIPINEN